VIDSHPSSTTAEKEEKQEGLELMIDCPKSGLWDVAQKHIPTKTS